MIVKFECIQDYEKRREGAYAQDELNIWANTPLPTFICIKSSVQKGGVFAGAYGNIFVV